MDTLKSLLSSLWLLVSRVSIRTKIVGITVGSVLLLGLAVALQTQATLDSVLRQQMNQQAMAIGRDLAARSTDPILTGQLMDLHVIIEDTARNYQNVRYAFIMDQSGNIVDSTFGPGFPPGLAAANSVASKDQAHLQALSTEEGPILDVAVPILDGQVGTARVGLSSQANQAIMEGAMGQIVTTTIAMVVLAILGAFLLALPISRAVRSLLLAAEAVGRGDFDRRAHAWAPDELGELSQTFNSMSGLLARSRADLLRRNRELEALNAAASNLADVREPDEFLAQGLTQALDAASFEAGGIMLLGKDQTLSYRCWRGLSAEFVEGVANLQIGEGIAGMVAASGEPIVVDDIAADPRVTRAATRGEGIRAFASIPVRGRAGVIGVLNVARRNAASVSVEDLRLLRALGSQIGIGLENAQLWEELRQRGAVRAELLARVIAAQEDERKRVARELHDEMNQALAALLIGLDQLATSPEHSPGYLERIGWLRGIVSGVLEEVHHLSLDLRPTALDDAGLVPGIARYLREYEGRHGLATDFRVINVDGVRLPTAAETAVFRMVQEALTNVVRHAKAASVGVLLERRGSDLVAVVEDDGCGFDPNAIAAAPLRDRLGLAGMAERAALVGGAITIESRPGVGTTVFVTVPIAADVQNRSGHE